MATQLLRTVDRWRFETPLALLLAAAAGFAVLAMPREIFGRVPLAGHMGTPGHVALALLLAIVCGVIGYRAMRRPAPLVPADADLDPADDIDVPSGLSEDRLVRLRRADRHPDAPPRAPIRASRDLGEPFMDVGAFVSPPMRQEPEATPSQMAAVDTIVDGDYVEVEQPDETPVEPAAAVEPIATAPVAEVPPADEYALGTPFVEAPPVAAIVPPAAAPRRNEETIAAMMARLSAGMERRAGRPVATARDMRPALRDALDELNRLAERRG